MADKIIFITGVSSGLGQALAGGLLITSENSQSIFEHIQLGKRSLRWWKIL